MCVFVLASNFNLNVSRDSSSALYCFSVADEPSVQEGYLFPRTFFLLHPLRCPLFFGSSTPPRFGETASLSSPPFGRPDGRGRSWTRPFAMTRTSPLVFVSSSSARVSPSVLDRGRPGHGHGRSDSHKTRCINCRLVVRIPGPSMRHDADHLGQIFSKDTQALFYNYKPGPVQRMLDFDYLCGASEAKHTRRRNGRRCASRQWRKELTLTSDETHGQVGTRHPWPQ